MTVDTERIMQKIAFIREQISDIKTLTDTQEAAKILSDKILVKGLKYSLQTAIESMIDIAFHVAAKQYHCAPEESRDAFRILKNNKIITNESSKFFQPWWDSVTEWSIFIKAFPTNVFMNIQLLKLKILSTPQE